MPGNDTIQLAGLVIPSSAVGLRAAVRLECWSPDYGGRPALVTGTSPAFTVYTFPATTQLRRTTARLAVRGPFSLVQPVITAYKAVSPQRHGPSVVLVNAMDFLALTNHLGGHGRCCPPPAAGRRGRGGDLPALPARPAAQAAAAHHHHRVQPVQHQTAGLATLLLSNLRTRPALSIAMHTAQH